jgi:Zinc carboxypeptidase
MLKRRSLLAALLAVSLMPFVHAQDKQKSPSHIPTPSEVLGFEVGADRKLADYKQISSYFKALAVASPRVQIEVLGKTTLGEDMFMALISTPENFASKAKYKDIARRLADPRGLTSQQIDQLAHDGKTILLITCNIHSTEIGSSQMSMEWAYKLATTQDPEYLRRLNDSIVLLVPSLNPDGETMVTEWYRKYVGTKYEGGRMPYIYHHYVGHDDNRDWFMLTQIETKNVNHMVYHDWFPQFWLDEHQMGDTGPRIYIPPNADPVSKLVNPLVHRGNNLMGADMGWRLEEAGKSGVIYGYSFDAYWPGGTRNTGWWKNMYGVLTEVASARIATPIDVTPDELQGGTKGLITYEQQINFPNPWPGGTWRLRDIMDYELIVSSAALETVSKYRQELLRGVASMATEAVQTADPQICWRIPAEDQRDPVTAARLVALLLEHGVEVRVSSDAKTFLIPTAQPYGRFVDEMMGIQRYPEVRPAPNSGILEPYDVAAWSLPLMMGVKAERVAIRPDQLSSARVLKDPQWPAGGLSSSSGKYFSIAARENNIFALANAMQAAAGQVFLAPSQKLGEAPEFIFAAHSQLAANAEKLHLQLTPRSDLPQGASQLKPVRIGIYKSFLGPIDEGWTRFVFDQYGFKYKSIENKEMRAGNLNNSYDVILLPDTPRDGILEGRESRFSAGVEVPPEYTGGIGKEGVHALRDFVDKGGTVITLANASDVLIGEDFGLPVRNALANQGGPGGRAATLTGDFNVPGSLLRVYLDTNHPVAAGMPNEINAFVDSPIAFQTSVPPPDIQRSVIARYPDDAKDILVSGYAHGAERLQRKAAAVAFQRGKGKVVMFGFRVQHRAQMEGTFQLLFNAILWAGT